MRRKEIILVIDDEETMRESCHQVLTKQGYQVELAEDGVFGLEKLMARRPDLVLLDLKMPRMDGMTVLAKAREIDSDIVIIVITGYATLESAIEAMKRGAYDFLPKPFTPEELRLIAKRGLERRRLVLETKRLEEEKDRMQKFFITMVSHQLRSPLATVQQNLELILGHMMGDVPVKQEELLVRIKRQISDLLQLIKDWLDLARIERNKVVKAFDSIPLGSILSETIQSLQSMADEKRVSFHLGQNGLPLIKGDPQSLKQLFGNLFNNAIRYNRSGGDVNVKLREKDTHVEVRVSDTGSGIAEADLPFIFDEFYRGKTDEVQKTKGTGLGLAIVKKIAEAHSGFVRVESVPGKGTTFIIGLPKC